MHSHLSSVLISGLFSAILFLGVAASGLGFFFLLVPTLPLFYAGLEKGSFTCFKAGMVAAIFTGLIGGPALGLMFLVFLGLPSWYIARNTLLWRADDSPQGRQWFPIGLIFTSLTLCACAFTAATVLYYAGEPGGIEAMLGESLRQEFQGIDPQYAGAVAALSTQWSFLIFSMTVWLWSLALYAHLWIAAHLLARLKKAPRESVAIVPFALPGALLFLLAVSALATLIGSPSMQFLGKSCLLSLLFPYFLNGIALMHAWSRPWPNRRFLLFFIYVLLVAQLWPVLALAGLGFWDQIKRLSSASTSTKG